MIDMPERIWAEVSPNSGDEWWTAEPSDLGKAALTEYIRADVSAARIADLETALHDAICDNVETIKRLAEAQRQLAEARDKALEEAAVAGGDAAVDLLLRQAPEAGPLRAQLTRQAITKAIRNLKGKP